MSQTVILETDYATLWFHPRHKIVHHKFHKFIYGEEFRRVLEAGLRLFQKEGATKWLSDDQSISLVPQADVDWSIANWMPAMLESGWKYWALVLPNKSIGQVGMKRVVGLYAQKGVTVEIFADAQQALVWLESV